jgi:release factor glutamine methyltransferase
VLIPRPETELLVQLTIDNGQLTIGESLVLDLCAGSGCVGIAIARETGCNVIAVEKSPQAAEYLRANIALNGVESQVKTIQADVLENQLSIVNCQLSIVINPPYLTRAEMQSLQKEVAHEPPLALFGGVDGLDFYRQFFEMWGDAIRGARLFATEVGDGQAAAVSEMLRQVGREPRVARDLSGIERVVWS